MFEISEDWDLEVGHRGPAGATRHHRRHTATFLHITARGTELQGPARALLGHRSDFEQVWTGPDFGRLVLEVLACGGGREGRAWRVGWGRETWGGWGRWWRGYVV